MMNYKPTLIANLQRDGVADYQTLANTMTMGYAASSTYFDLYCLKNERGDFCFPMYFHMTQDISANPGTNSSTVMDTICRYYYNGGCCLQSLANMYQGMNNNVSFTNSLALTCPALANYNPPQCLVAGAKAVALTVTMTLPGLACSAYLAQTAEFRAQYEAALKLDLASKGISASFININAITDANGVCTVKVLLRAGSDAETNGLNTAASTLNTATLTNSNQVLSTAAGTGTVSALGTASVSTITVQGGSAPDAGSAALAAPSVALLAAFLAWVA